MEENTFKNFFLNKGAICLDYTIYCIMFHIRNMEEQQALSPPIHMKVFLGCFENAETMVD